MGWYFDSAFFFLHKGQRGVWLCYFYYFISMNKYSSPSLLLHWPPCCWETHLVQMVSAAAFQSGSHLAASALFSKCFCSQATWQCQRGCINWTSHTKKKTRLEKKSFSEAWASAGIQTPHSRKNLGFTQSMMTVSVMSLLFFLSSTWDDKKILQCHTTDKLISKGMLRSTDLASLGHEALHKANSQPALSRGLD